MAIQYWIRTSDNRREVECNSDTVDEASDELCGAEITARCNSDGPVLFGIALALVGVEDDYF